MPSGRGQEFTSDVLPGTGPKRRARARSALLRLRCVGRPSGEDSLETAIEPDPSATRGRPSLALQRCLAEGRRGGDRRQTATRDCQSLGLRPPCSKCHIPCGGRKAFFVGLPRRESSRAGSTRNDAHEVSAGRGCPGEPPASRGRQCLVARPANPAAESGCQKPSVGCVLHVPCTGRASDEVSGATRVSGLIEAWREEYNRRRPHSALGYRPPAPEAIQIASGLT
jgi:hypothetical protein